MMLFSADSRRLLLACGALMLSGCVASTGAPSPVFTDTSAKPLLRCQNELAAMEQYDAARFKKYDAAITILLNNSARYLLTRDQMSEDTQSVIDSVYQARIAQDCQAIHIDLYKAVLAQANGDADQ